MKTIGERIRQARVAKGWSAFTLAKKVGYKTQSGIANLENKATGSGGNKIGDIAKALGVSVDWLLNGPDSENVPFLPPVLEQGPVLAPSKSVSDTVANPLYAVKNEAEWPFELFSQSDWLLLPKKEREEIENSIAGAVLRAKKTAVYASGAPHST
mgnify:CR=1 FL=1